MPKLICPLSHFRWSEVAHGNMFGIGHAGDSRSPAREQVESERSRMKSHISLEGSGARGEDGTDGWTPFFLPPSNCQREREERMCSSPNMNEWAEEWLRSGMCFFCNISMPLPTWSTNGEDLKSTKLSNEEEEISITFRRQQNFITYMVECDEVRESFICSSPLPLLFSL